MSINNERLAKFEGKKGRPFWYCTICNREIDGTEVTFQEYHDGCGGKVILKEDIDYSTSPDDRERLWGVSDGEGRDVGRVLALLLR